MYDKGGLLLRQDAIDGTRRSGYDGLGAARLELRLVLGLRGVRGRGARRVRVVIGVGIGRDRCPLSGVRRCPRLPSGFPLGASLLHHQAQAPHLPFGRLVLLRQFLG